MIIIHFNNNRINEFILPLIFYSCINTIILACFTVWTIWNFKKFLLNYFYCYLCCLYFISVFLALIGGLSFSIKKHQPISSNYYFFRELNDGILFKLSWTAFMSAAIGGLCLYSNKYYMSILERDSKFHLIHSIFRIPFFIFLFFVMNFTGKNSFVVLVPFEMFLIALYYFMYSSMTNLSMLKKRQKNGFQIDADGMIIGFFVGIFLLVQVPVALYAESLADFNYVWDENWLSVYAKSLNWVSLSKLLLVSQIPLFLILPFWLFRHFRSDSQSVVDS